jgi:hypothetical protein
LIQSSQAAGPAVVPLSRSIIKICYDQLSVSVPDKLPLMQITLEVSDLLGEKLQQLGDRLPEALDRVLKELTPIDFSYQDDHQIIEILASQPSPEVVLAIRPTPALQDRMTELLARNKSSSLSQVENAELDRYLLLEHWVRLAKAHAYKSLQTTV